MVRRAARGISLIHANVEWMGDFGPTESVCWRNSRKLPVGPEGRAACEGLQVVVSAGSGFTNKAGMCPEIKRLAKWDARYSRFGEDAR